MDFFSALLIVSALSGNISASQAEILIRDGQRIFVLKDVVVKTRNVEIHSDSGYYDEAHRKAVLWGNLIMHGTDYKVVSDTMIYVEMPESLIFSRNAVLEDTVYLLRSDRVVDTRDSAFAVGNIYLKNKKNGLVFTGDSGVYVPDIRKGIVIGNAFVEIGRDTSKIEVRADMIAFTEDTFFAYNHVKTTSRSMSTTSDSAYFIQSDSTAFLWSGVEVDWEKGTAKADTAVIKFSASRFKSMHLLGNATLMVKDTTGSVTLTGPEILISAADSSDFVVEGIGDTKGQYLPVATKSEEKP